MLRLLRLLFVLIIINAACIIVVIATHYSASTWGCITYDLFPQSILLDVTHGNFFKNRPFIVTDYSDSLTWHPTEAAGLVIYSYATPSGLNRIGFVNSERSIGYLDSSSEDGIYNSVFSVSADYKYMATLTHTIPATQPMTVVLTVRDLTTFAPIATLSVDEMESPRLTDRALTGEFYTEWSPTTFAFMRSVNNQVEITLISLQTGKSQTIPLPNSALDARFFWSPNGTSLAVAAGMELNALPRYLDLLALNNDHWDVVYSQPIDQGLYSPPTFHRRISQMSWNASGDTFSLLRKIDETHHELVRFPLAATPPQPVSRKLNNIYRPEFIFGGDWLCNLDNAGSLFTLERLTEPRLAYTLTSNCTDPLLAPDDMTLLASPLSSDTTTPPQWIGLHASPFRQFSVPSSVLSLLPLTEDPYQFVKWSADNKRVLLFLPNKQTPNDKLDGYLTAVDTSTGQWFTVQPSVFTYLAPDIAPDSSRFTVWNADRQHLMLMDTENHVITEMSFPIPITYPGVVSAEWSPDSQYLKIVYFTPPSHALLTILDRDGHRVTALDQSIAQPEVMNATAEGWSHCEPSPKFPRLNMLQ